MMILLLGCLKATTVEKVESESYQACISVCEQKNAAGCESVQNCDSSCQSLIGQIGEDCEDQALQLWACQEEQVWTCSDAGIPVPESDSCEQIQEDYLLCVEPEDTAQ